MPSLEVFSVVNAITSVVPLPQAMLQYTLFCIALYTMLSLLLPHLLDLSSSKELEANPKPIVNRVVASTHAGIMFYLAAMHWVTTFPSIMHAPNDEAESLQLFAIEIMLGYLLYDTLIDTIWPKKDGSWDKSMVIHHLLGFVSLGQVRYHASAAGAHYNMIVFLAEASTPALHMSWIMYALKKTSTIEYQLVGWSLVGLFFIFRVCLSPWLVFKMWTDRAVWAGEPAFMFEGNLSIVVVFMLMQFKWFYDLIVMAMKTSGTGDKKHLDADEAARAHLD